jgi:DNA-binding NarL/FixJ family response regulator
VVRESRNLLIVEDEPLVAGLLRDSLAENDFIIEVAHSSRAATEITRNFDPDIALVDINLGRGANGIDLAFILNKQHPGIAILLLTQHPDLRTAGFDENDLPRGCGFLRKDEVRGTEDILYAISALVQANKDVRQDGAKARPLARLTNKQIEVLRMVAQGYTNAEIARRRETSVRAVERMLTSIFILLEINDLTEINPRVEAARMFIEIAGTPDRS